MVFETNPTLLVDSQHPVLRLERIKENSGIYLKYNGESCIQFRIFPKKYALDVGSFILSTNDNLKKSPSKS